MLQLIARAGGIMQVLAQAGVHPDHNVRLVPEVQLAVTGGKTWKRTDLLMTYDIPEAPYATGGVQAVAPSRQRRFAPRPPSASAAPPQPPARAAGERPRGGHPGARRNCRPCGDSCATGAPHTTVEIKLDRIFILFILKKMKTKTHPQGVVFCPSSSCAALVLGNPHLRGQRGREFFRLSTQLVRQGFVLCARPCSSLNSSIGHFRTGGLRARRVGGGAGPRGCDRQRTYGTRHVPQCRNH